MFYNRITKKLLLIILVVVFLSPFFIFSSKSVLAEEIYSRELKEFIKNDKEIRLLLKEKKSSVRITPNQDLKIINQKEKSILLKKDITYKISQDYKAEKRWKLQVFASQNRSKAENIVNKLRNKGYEDPKLLRENSLYKVQLGDFPKREASESLAVKLARDGWNTWPVSYETGSEKMTMTIYGPEDEKLFSGQKFQLSGSLKMNGILYKGDFVVNFTSSGLEVFNNIDFDKFITAILSAEIHGRARLSDSKYEEALKAQAIVIRTKVLNNIIEEDKLVYRPSEFNNFRGFNFYKSYAENAVNKSKGVVVTYNDQIINSFYHKNSGGKTAEALNILGKDLPYLKSVSDQRAIDDPFFLPNWSVNYSEEDLMKRFANYFNKDISGIRDIKIGNKTDTNRIVKVVITTDYGNYQLQGEEIRDFFQVKSLIFESDKKYNSGYLQNITFSGIGIGSGLGLSQDGAQIMAKEGKSYKEIINYYYKQSSLKDLNFINYTRQLVDAKVTTGLKYKELRQINWNGPRIITILEYEVGSRNIAFNNFLAGSKISGLADLSDAVKQRKALAAVNGGFYQANGNPLGLFIQDNKIISESINGRAALAQTNKGRFLIDRVSWTGKLQKLADNQSLAINNVNKIPIEDEVTIYNNYYGNKVPLLQPEMTEIVVKNGKIVSKVNSITIIKSKIPENGFIIQAPTDNNLSEFKVGDKVEFINHFNRSNWNKSKIVTAIGGGPLLIDNGKIKITGKEGKFQNDILQGRAPRTSVGITKQNNLVFFTVDGRQPELSVGITLKELAYFMKGYGIKQGMNLDGGASARMVVRGYTMSNPSRERLLSNGLIFYKNN